MIIENISIDLVYKYNFDITNKDQNHSIYLGSHYSWTANPLINIRTYLQIKPDDVSIGINITPSRTTTSFSQKDDDLERIIADYLFNIKTLFAFKELNKKELAHYQNQLIKVRPLRQINCISEIGSWLDITFQTLHTQYKVYQQTITLLTLLGAFDDLIIKYIDDNNI